MDFVEKSALMMDAFRDFLDLCQKYEGDRGQGFNDFEEYNSVKEEELEIPQYDPWSMSLMDLCSPPRSTDEFPAEETMASSVWDINAEDPELYSGKSMGIPYAVAVRQSNGDDKLIPIVNGKFQGYGL